MTEEWKDVIEELVEMDNGVSGILVSLLHIAKEKDHELKGDAYDTMND